MISQIIRIFFLSVALAGQLGVSNYFHDKSFNKFLIAMIFYTLFCILIFTAILKICGTI